MSPYARQWLGVGLAIAVTGAAALALTQVATPLMVLWCLIAVPLLVAMWLKVSRMRQGSQPPPHA